MKVRHESEKSYRSDNLITYTQKGAAHREDGPAFVDRKFGCGYWLGGVQIISNVANHWEKENEVKV